MDEQDVPNFKRRRVNPPSPKPVFHTSDEQDLQSTTSQPLAAGHVYPAVFLGGNSQAIFGDVGDSSFFRNNSNDVSKRLLLDALYFEGIQSRRDQIAARAGSPKYIEWVWTTNFNSWLQGSDSFYWITGCPGSGKSTLMKHISESRKTLNALQANGSRWIAIHFFFDFRAKVGTANTINGMLRSLLHQIAKRLPEVTKHLESSFLLENPPSRELHTYMDGLCDAIQQTSTNICAFIDGLDEFAGSGSDLLEAIYSLEDRSGIKICMASRPYPVFEDNLAAYQHLVMQDHNYQSIQMYTEAQFKSNRIVETASLPRQLAEKLSKKARGVFLWARLATDELLRDLLAGKSVMELEHRLSQMPPEVQEMYQQILDRLPAPLRIEGALLLYMLASSKGTVEVRKLFVAMETLASRHSKSDIIQPVDEKTNHEFRLLALLGDFVDVIYEESGPGTAFILEEGNIASRSIWAPVPKARLTHETLYTYLTKNKWLEDTLNLHFTLINGPGFWFNLYVDEILHSLETCEALSVSTLERYRSVLKKLADPLIFNKTSWTDGETEIMGNHDFTAVRHGSLDTIEAEMHELLKLWKGWTPLLPYALHEIFPINSRHIKHSYNKAPASHPSLPSFLRNVGQKHRPYHLSGARERVDDLQRILHSPASWLHKLMCAFQGFQAEIGLMTPGTWNICGYDTACKYANSLMLLDPHISIPLCHDMSSYLTSLFSKDQCSIPPAARQSVFDFAWDRYMCDKWLRWQDLLLLLAPMGNYFKGQHLCQFLRTDSNISGCSLILDLLRLCQNVQSVLSEHQSDCIYNQSATPEAHFLCHWAYVSANKGKVIEKDLVALLGALSIDHDHLSQISALHEEPLLNMILQGSCWSMVLKFSLALQAGANPRVVGRSGTAFDVARHKLGQIWEHESDVGSGTNPKSVELEKIIELLDYYANHDGELPQNMDEFLKFNV